MSAQASVRFERVDSDGAYILDCRGGSGSFLNILPPERVVKDLRKLTIRLCVSTLPSTIGLLREMTELVIESCTFFIAPPPTFTRLSKLEKITIKRCSFQSHILPHHLSRLENLTTISLVDNASIEFLPRMLNGLSTIEDINLEGSCRHPNLTEELWCLQPLKRLSIRNNPTLALLPTGIAQLQNLEQLMISNCQSLKTLPDEIGLLANLKGLEITRCPVSEISASIGSLTHLESLLIRALALQSLPAEIGKLQNLKHLSILDCSQLQALPSSHQFKRLTKLERLHISGSNCPFQLPVLPSLKHLVLIEVGHLDSVKNICCDPRWKEVGCLERLKIWCCDLGDDYTRILRCLPRTVTLVNMQSCNIQPCGRLLEKGLLPRGIRSLDLGYYHSRSENAFSNPRLSVFRFLLESYEELVIQAGGWEMQLPKYETYLQKLNQCGRMLLHSPEKASPMTREALPLSAWPIVLARVRRVCRRSLTTGLRADENERSWCEYEASIIYTLLQGPAFLCRPVMGDNLPRSNKRKASW